jgi:hypothetical protein
MVLLVTTCGGRDSQYLRRLVAQIDSSGWRGSRIVVSDGRPSEATGWRTSASAHNEGQKRTYWRALTIGLEEARRKQFDRILILEDDVFLCRNALQYMERARLPRILDFVTWFDGHAVPPRARFGIYPVLGRSFFCLQGVTWSRATAERLVTAPAARQWKERHSGDILIAKILAGSYYGVHVPNLVQHLGATSVCNPGQGLTGVRVANNYPGDDFDALRLGRSAPAAAASGMSR